MKNIKNILICGAGMMGKNIGYVFASNPDFQVGMYDLYPTDVEAGIRTNTKQLLDKGVITEEELSDRLSRISFTTDIDSDLVKNADLVIEAVFEDMKIKRETFAKLEARCRPDTIFCTNSSVMSPSEISAELKHRERFVGTHFWNPGHLIPLVEVVKSDASSDETAQTVMEVLRSVGKKPVLCRKDVPGFIANRMQHALWREAISIVEHGIADAATVDEAVRYSFGLRLPQLGPMENADMVGTDLTYLYPEGSGGLPRALPPAQAAAGRGQDRLQDRRGLPEVDARPGGPVQRRAQRVPHPHALRQVIHSSDTF